MKSVIARMVLLLSVAFLALNGAALAQNKKDSDRYRDTEDERDSRQLYAEQFSQTYPLSATGRISLKNINGKVSVSSWSRNEVKVEAVKRAYKKHRLDEVTIDIDADRNSIRIESKYNRDSESWNYGDGRERDNPASVEYILTVPRRAQIDGIELINGALDLHNLDGEVYASSINGKVTAEGLTNKGRLSTINGRLEVDLTALPSDADFNLSSVNGGVLVKLADNADANLEAETVHGGISNDFGLTVEKGRYVGRSLEGRLGKGNARVKVNNVNGSISIRRS